MEPNGDVGPWTGHTFGPYQVEALIGRGGMAEVYRVRHSVLMRYEAMKILPSVAATDPELVTRFLQEARTAAALHHPCIADIHAIADPTIATQPPYFTMELMEGGDLAHLLRARGRLSLTEALPILAQAAEAIDHAHAHGILHRDIKPANILLTHDGRAKVADFGIARARDAGSGYTSLGILVGTPEYMSPEQSGSLPQGHPLTPASDQYALACVAFALLTGEPPFPLSAITSPTRILMHHVATPPPPPESRVPELSHSVRDALLRALAKDPAQRFPSCRTFVETLGSSPQVRENRVIPTPVPSRIPKWIAATVMVLAVSGLIGYGIRGMTASSDSNSTPQGKNRPSALLAPSASPSATPSSSTARKFTDLSTADAPQEAAQVVDGRRDTAFILSRATKAPLALTWPNSRTVTRLGFIVGDSERRQGKRDPWKQHGRVRSALLTFRMAEGERHLRVRFADSRRMQFVEVPAPLPVATGITVRVEEVYAPSAPPNDAALGEIEVWGY